MQVRRGWFIGLALAFGWGVPTAQGSPQLGQTKPKAGAQDEDVRAAKLSKARFAMDGAPGATYLSDSIDSAPLFFPQGRADLRYVVVDAYGNRCMIAQSYDGRRVHRLWKLPTRRVFPGERSPSGTLARALFDQGYVAARNPNPEIARALSRRCGIAGNSWSVPGSRGISWFVDASGKVHKQHNMEMPNKPAASFYFAITPEERAALGWSASVK